MLEAHSVFGRVTPHQKRAMVGALQLKGHVVAMTGDGVNDALALKDADIGVAMGSGAAATRAVAQLVLLDGKFAALPGVVAEGRRVIANIERSANLFVTKTVYATFLAIAVVIAGWKYPFLPRHLTIISTFTIGIPGFFLAIAPNKRRYIPGFVERVLRFTVPAGIVAFAATMVSYGVARFGHDLVLIEARTTATLVLIAVGLWVLVIQARPFNWWKTVLVGVDGRCHRADPGDPRSARLLRVAAPAERGARRSSHHRGGRDRAPGGGLAPQSRRRQPPRRRAESSGSLTASLALLEHDVEHDHHAEHARERERIAERPVELGHVLEVHAVDAGDQRRAEEDGAPRRDLLHDVVQAVRDHREVGLEQAGEQVALRLDEVERTERAVEEVAEEHDRLVADERHFLPRDRVDDFAHRRHRAAELRQDRGGARTRPAGMPSWTVAPEHLLFDVVEAVVDRVGGRRSSGR